MYITDEHNSARQYIQPVQAPQIDIMTSDGKS